MIFDNFVIPAVGYTKSYFSFLLYLFGYTWPRTKIFVIPEFVIHLNKYNKKNTLKNGLLTVRKIQFYLY